MGISHLPLPSFTFVLTSNYPVSRIPPVVREKQSDHPRLLPTAPAHFMRTIDHDDDTLDEAVFAYLCPGDSETDLGHSDSDTIFEDKRPITSRGPRKPFVNQSPKNDSKPLILKYLYLLKKHIPHIRKT